MALKYLIESAKGGYFPIENIPFGICRLTRGDLTPCTRVGNQFINLAVLEKFGVFRDITHEPIFLEQTSLQAFMSQPKRVWTQVRHRIQTVLQEEKSITIQACLISGAHKVMPFQVTDFTDFSASLSHAENLKDKLGYLEKNQIRENFKTIPVAYHGRSSSVIPSGYAIRRPHGPVKTDEGILLRPTNALDFELEMGVVIGGETNEIGNVINVNKAEDVIFGVVMLNDWAARDIQLFESSPLGPFVSKNFATSISPWVISLDALEPFRKTLALQSPTPASYLVSNNLSTFDVDLEVRIKTPSNTISDPIVLTNLSDLYWSLSQLVAHHTITGCPLRVGSLIGTGTISGLDTYAFGSLFEWNSKGNRVQFTNGEQREYLQDGDEVIIRGWARNSEFKIGFGELRNSILPAFNYKDLS